MLQSSSRPHACAPAREDLPRFLEPMLLINGAPPAGDEWAAEVKWDGMRAQVRLEGGKLCLRSRPGRNCTVQFPELEPLAHAVPAPLLLDAELVCLDPEGRPDFTRLRRRLSMDGRGTQQAAAREPATLMIFDLLHHDGFAVRELPYRRRRELLGELGLEGPYWRTPGHFPGRCRELADATRSQGLEGVVLKQLDAPWQPGRRSRSWIKHKHRRREELHLWGWRPDPRSGLETLLLARPDRDQRLRTAGEVTFGLGRAERERLRMELERLASTRGRAGVRWLDGTLRVAVDHHGSRQGPVRDGVLREVLDGSTA